MPPTPCSCNMKKKMMKSAPTVATFLSVFAVGGAFGGIVHSVRYSIGILAWWVGWKDRRIVCLSRMFDLLCHFKTII